MKFLFLKKIFKRAFSLIELSIVIIIISILLSGALSIATSTTNSAKIKTTNNNIDEIYKALKVYLLANNRLPCPAPITAIKASSTTYGESAVNYGTCSASGIYTSATSTNVVYGMVPVKDLELSIEMAEDGFGNKLAYIVDKRFTKSSTFGLSASNSGLMMKVKEITSAESDQEITSAGSDQENNTGAIFLIISHGANKSGAFGVNSATQNTASDDGKEQLNYAVPTGDATASIENTFYYRAGNSDVFDDVVFYKTRNMMVTESNAFNIISCPALAGTSSGISYGGTYMTWGEGKYGQIVTANSLCPTGYRATVKYPTKRCNTFGQWQDGVVDPCTESNISVISECTGGTITDITDNGIVYNIHTFTASGTFNCTTSITADILVVGGGGGGGGNGGGGGGGGGVIERTSFTIPSGNRSVVVGGKGIGNNTSSSSQGNGSPSRFEGIDSAMGGGGGASKLFTTGGGFGSYGGSGGGGAGTIVNNGLQANKGSGVSGQGSDGGSGFSDGSFGSSGGGGGGKSSNGTNAVYRQGGAGGNGHTSSISGTPYVYSSGGGGGRSGSVFVNPSGVGGSGAGRGGTGSSVCCSLPGGTATSYGSGGGGGGQTTSGGNGKEGIVIIRYRK